jgi:hypothetical protein
MASLVMSGTKNEDGSHDWRSALEDAAIISGFTFMSSMAAIVSTGDIDLGYAMLRAGIATGVAFFSSLMVSLKIQKP